ncbi:hypothetical protein NQ317_015550 [Molorchus minor]|uniref:DUF5641 domain-containing protein n=1 Tax=Molorchus minor TaxID=1323400 RepID=A0ABQ9JF52_9CUCU|nr:hypothetical protein NQ317_015550 [Molorchus minor]
MEPFRSRVNGISNISSCIKARTKISIFSTRNAFHEDIFCSVLQNITSKLPNFSFRPDTLEIPPNLQLADPSFCSSGNIDLLLGASVFWNSLCVGQVSLGAGKPIMHKTKFGWILSGNCTFVDTSRNLANQECSIIQSYHSVEDSLSRFWELEEVGDSNRRVRGDCFAENHYLQNTSRDENGRFVVGIPFYNNVKSLGESRSVALKRLFSIERKLSRDSYLKAQYHDFLDEYERLGHMSRIAEEDPISSDACYLPHHCVLKESSTTTKVRVVFDASAKTSSGLSLNDVQAVGPVIQRDLVWNPAHDFLAYSVGVTCLDKPVTKRGILSTAAQVFDPLGLVAPVVIIIKLLIQTLWRLKLSWDESVPQDLHLSFLRFRDQLSSINRLKLPRHVLLSNAVRIELHGFADASEKAYGCCVYVRSIDSDGNVAVKLFCSKSKVAPIKTTSTLPRLELCACVLLAKLIRKIISNISFKLDKVWPIDRVSLETIDLEARPQACFVNSVSYSDLFDRFSSFKTLRRHIAYWYRYLSNLKAKVSKQKSNISPLTVEELRLSARFLLKLVQKQDFDNELKLLSENKSLPRTSKLLSLNPFLDEFGLIRVGGRLCNSQFSYDKKYPILLPKHHRATKLIAHDRHIELLHCGPQQLLFSLREEYWPISGRSVVKQVVHSCVVCFKANPRTHFWDRWRRDYINHLQVRSKWKNKLSSVKLGDMVIVKEDNISPCHWKLGRIVQVHQGPDGHIRVVTLKCASGEIKRPITKICLLPISDNS